MFTNNFQKYFHINVDIISGDYINELHFIFLRTIKKFRKLIRCFVYTKKNQYFAKKIILVKKKKMIPFTLLFSNKSIQILIAK